MANNNPTEIILKQMKDLKELIEVVNHKVGSIDANQRIYSAQLVLIKDKQSVLNDKLDEVTDTQKDHTRKLEALSGDVEQLLTDVKGTEMKLDFGTGETKEKLMRSKN